jgi:hypothetical protein
LSEPSIKQRKNTAVWSNYTFNNQSFIDYVCSKKLTLWRQTMVERVVGYSMTTWHVTGTMKYFTQFIEPDPFVSDNEHEVCIERQALRIN